METAIYGRVSTEEQALEGYSIRGQVEKLQSYVSAKSWSIYDVYLDEGISGKNLTERPAVTRMIEDIKAGNVKSVLIYKLDRLTRSVADLVYLIDLFNAYGCAFNSLSESIDTSTASGRMFVKVIGIFAEFERENIGERVRLGKERKAKEGFTTACAIISYGYDRAWGEKVQRINKQEALVVRRIFEMYVKQNMSLNGIAKVLNKEKIPSKMGATWNSASIYGLLQNCNYIGCVRYSMDTPERYFEAEGKHEAIISEELFNEAQLLLEKNKKATPTKKPSERNYFTGLVYCGLCGRKRKSHTSKMNDKTAIHHLICGGHFSKLCDAKSVAAAKIERTLIGYFANILDIPTDNEKEEQTKQAAITRIEKLNERIKAFDDKEKEMLNLYIEDKASLLEYRSVKAKLDVERARIAEKIENLTPAKKALNMKTISREEIIFEFNSNWGNFTDVEKRQFLLKYISKITVINHPIKGTCRGRCEITDIEFKT